MVPVGLADELLQALAFAVVQVGDGLGVLALQVGEQALDVVVGVGALLGDSTGIGRRVRGTSPDAAAARAANRGGPPRRRATHPAGPDSGVPWLASPGRSGYPELLYANALRSGRLTDTVELFGRSNSVAANQPLHRTAAASGGSGPPWNVRVRPGRGGCDWEVATTCSCAAAYSS